MCEPRGGGLLGGPEAMHSECVFASSSKMAGDKLGGGGGSEPHTRPLINSPVLGPEVGLEDSAGA